MTQQMLSSPRTRPLPADEQLRLADEYRRTKDTKLLPPLRAAVTQSTPRDARAELLDMPIEMLVPERLRGKHPAHVAGFMTAP